MRLHDTRTRKLVPLVPLEPGHVRLYTCGPTVYDFAHIGNFRTYVWEDLLRRTLKLHGFRVTQVMNITDIEDKIIAKAVASGTTIEEVTLPFIQAFYEALTRSLPVGDALREAKLEALGRGVPPREWAAFTTVGDPLVSVKLREPWPEIWSAVMLVAALAFGAAGVVFARRSLSRSATESPVR